MPDRIKRFLWRVVWNALPTQSILARFIQISPVCPLCNLEDESLDHLFLKCPFSLCIWRKAHWPLNLDALNLSSVVAWIKIIINPVRRLNLLLFDEHAFMLFAAFAMDIVWFARNQKIHNLTPADPNQIFRRVQSSLRQHLLA